MSIYPSVAVASRAQAESRARERGHKARYVCDWMDNDDSEFHSECSCGWRSKPTRTRYQAREAVRVHMQEVSR